MSGGLKEEKGKEPHHSRPYSPSSTSPCSTRGPKQALPGLSVSRVPQHIARPQGPSALSRPALAQHKGDPHHQCPAKDPQFVHAFLHSAETASLSPKEPKAENFLPFCGLTAKDPFSLKRRSFSFSGGVLCGYNQLSTGRESNDAMHAFRLFRSCGCCDVSSHQSGCDSKIVTVRCQVGTSVGALFLSHMADMSAERGYQITRQDIIHSFSTIP